MTFLLNLLYYSVVQIINKKTQKNIKIYKETLLILINMLDYGKGQIYKNN